MTNPLIFSTAHMSSSRQSKNMLHVVKNKAHVYYQCTVIMLKMLTFIVNQLHFSIVTGLAYPFVLILCATVYAFKTRKLPGTYNETKVLEQNSISNCNKLACSNTKKTEGSQNVIHLWLICSFNLQDSLIDSILQKFAGKSQFFPKKSYPN